MKKVKAKKHLGQHFLIDEEIALNIVKGLTDDYSGNMVLEVGPGMGVLTKYLLEDASIELHVAEIDVESVDYLKTTFPALGDRIIDGDFLQMRLDDLFDGQFAIIGNFPYNISSQIFFKVLEYKDQVTHVVGMLQKEVAERIASPPGSKKYGILSVLLQAYYDIEYLFTVHEDVFDPPPKVKSGVIRVVRNETMALSCDEKLFKRVVKQGFNNRRKTLRNALKSLNLPLDNVDPETLSKRAEQLSVADFVTLTQNLTA